MKKSTLRQQMKRIRSGLTAEARQLHSAAILKAVTQSAMWREANIIGFYASFRNEVDTWAIMEQALADGKQLALPKVVSPNHPLAFYTVTKDQSGWSLSRGAFGVMEPNASCPELPSEQLDVLFIPALALSKDGHRLGWGGGYYDRTLATLPNTQTFACVFDCQIVPFVPTDAHDIPLEGWFTESGQYP